MAKEDKTADAKAKPKKKPHLLLVIIGVVVLALLGGGGFLAWKMFMPPKVGNQAAATHGAVGPQASGHSGGENKGGEPSGAETGGGTISLDPFLVNLSDQDSNRYLKATIRILVNNAEMAKKISENDVITPRLRDTILSILSTKVANEIINNDGKQKLKKEILEKINGFLPEKCAKDIFFTDFVVQL
jgi:flagellar FliL protein